MYADGKLITAVTINNSGVARVTGIRKETYIEVVETAAPAGHVLDQTSRGIHIDPYDPAIEDDPVLTVTNKARPALRILKYDLTSNKPMPDVTFEVWHDGDLFGEYTTNTSGEIFLYDLEPGTYLVKEIATYDDHVVNSIPQQIELKAGDTQTRELEAPEGYLIDDAVPAVRLIKTSSDGSRLGGVHFCIAKIEDGSHYLDRITDDSGKINIDELNPGVYSVKETTTTFDHILDVREYHVELFPVQTSTIIIENQRRSNLTIRKTDKDTGDPIPGVTFTLNFADGPHHYQADWPGRNSDSGEIYFPAFIPSRSRMSRRGISWTPCPSR